MTKKKRYALALEIICGICYDYDGYFSVEGLKSLIDDIHDYAHKAVYTKEPILINAKHLHKKRRKTKC